MPKKSATARGGAQRTKAKTQKSFELVRPVVEVQEQEEETEEQDVADIATTSVAKASTRATVPAAKTSVPEIAVEPVIAPVTSTAPKGTSTGSSSSGPSRTAARRQAAQQRTPRIAAPLVTSEHYAYVRKDLMFIAILAIIMFAAIIVLHFTLG